MTTIDSVAFDNDPNKVFDAIPTQLKALKRFVLWRQGDLKPDGRFAKIPLNPTSMKAGSAHDPSNWLCFADAVAAYEHGKCSGIGLALDGQPDSEGGYLTCIDVDAAAPPELAAELFERLGHPWMERSPSGTGWHLWMWCLEPLKGGNAGHGRELYQRRQFVTLTGRDARGTLCDATEELRRLHAEWFGAGAASLDLRLAAGYGFDATTLALIRKDTPPPETTEEIARVRSMLDTIGADCHRDLWRQTVWGLLGTGWSCAEDMAREWSESAPGKFKLKDFDDLIRDYKPHLTGYDALVKSAKQAGWQPETPSTVTADTFGDVRNARAFAGQWRGKLVYVSSRKAWLRWTDQRWELCQRGEEMTAAKAVCAELVHEATAQLSSNHTVGKQLMQHAVASHSLPRLEAMVRLAQSEGGMSVVETELDADPYLLGVANGVVDLRSGSLEANRPEDYITRYCSARFDPDATCPRWLRFLDEIFMGDADTITAVQTLLGYTLSGLSREEIMVIAYGYGANGKSVFGNVVHSIMGGYSTVAASSLLVARAAHDTGPRDDLASLAGARHVSINELQSGDRLDERVVKVLAGREPISARFLYGTHFSYHPTFTAWLRTNHRPIIHGTDEGIWRRLVLLPFQRQFEPHERDTGLEQKLHAERDGILTWMVAGAVRYLREGLHLSPAMKAEQTAYRKESDLLGEFLADTTRPAPSERVEQTHLFTAWQLWCQSNGIHHGSKVTFTRRVSERGFAQAKSNGKRFYCGLTMAA